MPRLFRVLVLPVLLALPMVAASLGWRVKVEEAALREQLGDDYGRYMREVPSRFLPGIS